MDSENQVGKYSTPAPSGPVLREAQHFINRTPETANDDVRNRSSIIDKPLGNVRGISIDMSLVLDESSDIQSERPFDEYFSPLSEDSTMQPSMRPRPPISARHEETNHHQQKQQPHVQDKTTLQNKGRKNPRPSDTVMSSRRATILAKVSSRITRLRQDKKLNDRFTVPKMDRGDGPQSLPELQDLCVNKPEAEHVIEQEQQRPNKPPSRERNEAAKRLKHKEPPGKVISESNEHFSSPDSTDKPEAPKKSSTEREDVNLLKLSFRNREEVFLQLPSSGCKTPNPSPAMTLAEEKAFESIPEDETVPDCLSGKPSTPPPVISTQATHIDVFDSIRDRKTEPDTPQMTNRTKAFHTQHIKDLKICVDAYSHPHYMELVESLSMSRGVRTLSVIRKHESEGIRTRRPADLDHLFHVLHSLSVSLSELYLWNFRLQDLTSLSLGLYDHASIQHLQLHMETGTLDEDAAKTLGSMPQLVSLELEVKASFPVWPLLSSNALTVLSVVGDHFVFGAADVLDMSDTLETNSVLQILDLEPQIPAWCLMTLVTSIRASPDSNLETFQFSCKTEDEQDGDACMLEIIKLMKRQHCKLRVLWNHCSEFFQASKELQDSAITSLYVCDNMHQFQVFRESDEYRDLKTHVLERNMREAVERDSGKKYEL